MGPVSPDDCLDFKGLADISAVDVILDKEQLKKCSGKPIVKISTKRQYEVFDGSKTLMLGRFSAVHLLPIGESGEAIHEESRLLSFCRTK